MSEYLEVSSLHKFFRSGLQRLDVLRGLDLAVAKGELLAITGESGAGKSTFLHLLGGMEKPDAGSIRFKGQEIGDLAGEELARYRNKSVGFIFQFHHLLPEFSALENVMFPLLLRRLPVREATERARHLLDEVGLAERIDHQPGEMSGGEQQRVAIARALVGEPHLLLGDEPTGNLDLRTSEAIHQLLLEIHKRHGLTSIIVTHNLLLAGLCDSQRHMVDGRLE